MISSNFALLSNSYVYNHKEEFLITSSYKNSKNDLGHSYDYSINAEMNQEISWKLNEILLENLLKYKYPFYSNYNFFNYHSLLYINKYKGYRLTDIFEKYYDLDKEKMIKNIKVTLKKYIKEYIKISLGKT